MSTLAAQLTASLTVTETLSAAESPASSSAGNTRKFDNYNDKIDLTATSTPKLDGAVVDLSTTIAAGPTPTDFDLQAAPLARDVGETVDCSGKKFIGMKVQANAANNAAGITIGPNGGNAYDLFGSGITITVYPGQKLLVGYGGANSQHAAVDGSNKDIRVNGAADDQVNILAIFGSDAS